MARFGDERAPLDMTKSSSVQVIRVCPHCKRGNQVGKNWYAGVCRNCGKIFNADKALSIKRMEGDVSVASQNPIDKAKTGIKAEMEQRAYAYAEERDQMKRDSGQRKRHHKSVLNRHFDGNKHRDQ